MPRYVVQLGRSYVVWSTVVDAPVSWGYRSFRELETAWKAQDHSSLPERDTANGAPRLPLWSNRAGPDEEQLTVPELEEFYVKRKTDPTKEALAAYRKGKS